jgi:peptidoglycan/LPS O-acetylase OafA/YrhL
VSELDGIRGMAVLMTVVAHSFFAAAPGGGLTGVAVFFVLSGFLITSLLVGEWAGTGAISLRNFFIRRLLRLMPALIVLLAGYVLLAYTAFNPVTLGDRLRAAFFVATYFGNWQNANGSNLAELSHTWSVAVEDQFYFIWPVLLAIALRSGARPRHILIATCAAAGGLILLRSGAYAAGLPWHRIYYGTDMVGSSLLIGCVTGLAFTWRLTPERLLSSRLVAWLALLFLLASTILVSQHGEPGRGYLATLGFPLIAVATAILILAVARDATAAPFLRQRWLVWFGRISYALYLWHLLMIQLLAKVAHFDPLERSVLSVPIAIGLAAFSYWIVEAPALRLKARFAPRPSRATAPTLAVAPPAAAAR